MSIRRSHGGSRPSSATSSRSGSGPPSTSIRPPRPPSTRIASPCPTSRTVIRVVPSARCATATERHDRDGDGQRAREPRRGGASRPVADVGARLRRPGVGAAPGVAPTGAGGRRPRRPRAAPPRISDRRRRGRDDVHGGSSVTLANGSAAPPG